MLKGKKNVIKNMIMHIICCDNMLIYVIFIISQ